MPDPLTAEQIHRTVDTVIAKHGFSEYRWIDPKTIRVAQWVRMKCTFGCPEYGHSGCCPPNTPSVAECERFFGEYTEAVVFRFNKKVDKPEQRHAWTRKVNLRLVKLERDVFLAGFERAFLLYMDSCCLCEDCSGKRDICKMPRMARPAPEAMAVDVYSTVRQYDFPIAVRTTYEEDMNRYAFLMVR